MIRKAKAALALALSAMLLAGCSAFGETDCSDQAAKDALETAIREGLEDVTLKRAKDKNGNLLIGSSSVRASIGKLKLIIEDICTTKEDPNSTKRFCTGSLKIVFSAETFQSADAARELLGLPKIETAIEGAELDKGVDYLKDMLDYSVQPTDDGSTVFAEFEGADGKLDIFYAPVVTRFVTYGIGVPGFAQAYMQAIWEHDWMREWIDAAEEEEWVIEQFEMVR
jgi:hypothetical protein